MNPNWPKPKYRGKYAKIKIIFVGFKMMHFKRHNTSKVFLHLLIKGHILSQRVGLKRKEASLSGITTIY